MTSLFACQQAERAAHEAMGNQENPPAHAAVDVHLEEELARQLVGAQERIVPQPVEFDGRCPPGVRPVLTAPVELVGDFPVVTLEAFPVQQTPRGPSCPCGCHISSPFTSDGNPRPAGFVCQACSCGLPVMPSNEFGQSERYNWHPKSIECIDVIEAFEYNLANAIKYIWRAGAPSEAYDGDRAEDLRKAIRYIEREIERM